MQIRTVPEPGAAALAADSTQGCLAITWPYAPPHQGISSTEEILATFDGAIADRHPPTGPTQDTAGIEHPGREGVRLLTWGDPYLLAWLEAMRGEPLTDVDFEVAGLDPTANPLRSGHLD